MRRVTPWLAGAALLAAAGAVVAVTPSATALRDAFSIHGEVGEVVESRTLVATVVDAGFADQVTDDEAEWVADGNWLVVTVAASARQTEVDAELPLATLVVDGETFQATERVSSSLTRTDLRVGTMTTGALAFELPAGLRAGHAELRLSPALLTPHLDDVLAIRLDLDELQASSSIALPEPSLGAS